MYMGKFLRKSISILKFFRKFAFKNIEFLPVWKLGFFRFKRLKILLRVLPRLGVTRWYVMYIVTKPQSNWNALQTILEPNVIAYWQWGCHWYFNYMWTFKKGWGKRCAQALPVMHVINYKGEAEACKCVC